MRRSSPLHQAALWWCVLLCLAVRITRAQSQDLYRRVGDGVVLRPDLSSVGEPITSISWKHGDHLAIEWDRDGGVIEAYRQFRGQATLNISTAELKISGLTGNFSGKYEVEVNGKPIASSSTVLKVISPVSKPTVSWRCDEGLTSCLLSCDGGDVSAQDDQVLWRRDVLKETDSPKQLNITKERDADYKEFRCVLVNQVSEESSEPVVNPLSTMSRASGETEKPVEGQKWMTGLTVFICLLAVLVVVALVHRSKAGFWFYDTEFMPWEANFWRRSETAGADHAANGRAVSNAEAAESNGTNAAREQRHEEAELMAETAIP